MIDTKELELKFKVNDLELSKFTEFAQSLPFIKRKDASSFDFYYSNENNPDEFIRFRDSTTPELTIKRQTQSSNNLNRVEVDLALNHDKVTEPLVNAWISLIGYKKNFVIFKTAFIYWLDNVNICYYIVYNEEMKELDRYVEVEYNKELVNKIGEEQALKELKEFEQKLVALGISPQNRLKRSLYQIYRK